MSNVESAVKTHFCNVWGFGFNKAVYVEEKSRSGRAIHFYASAKDGEVLVWSNITATVAKDGSITCVGN